MADTTIVKQNTVWISESEYEAKKLAGTLENNTVYNITKDSEYISKSEVEEGYVAKQTPTTTGISYLYAYDNNGDKAFPIANMPTANTIAYRHSGGRLYVGMPSENTEAVNLVYANEHYVGLQIPAATRSVVAINTDGTQELITLHGGYAVQGSIPLRSTGGVVRVGTPVGDNDAATKAYVDERTIYIHHLSAESEGGYICITFATDASHSDPITDLYPDSTGGAAAAGENTLTEILSYTSAGHPVSASGFLGTRTVWGLHSEGGSDYLYAQVQEGGSNEQVDVSIYAPWTIEDTVI